MSYFLAPSLDRLRAEVNERWPLRDKTSDGWIGDEKHSSRESQHNPDWAPPDPGIIRALDVDIDGIDKQALLDELIGDPRVWYVIHDRHIWSRTYGFAKRVYAGPNPHHGHIHVSIRLNYEAAHDLTPWFQVAKVRGKRKMPHEVAWRHARTFVIARDRRGPVADAINAFLGLGGDRISEKTIAAAAKFQAQNKTWRRDGRIGYGTYRLMAKESKRRAKK